MSTTTRIGLEIQAMVGTHPKTGVACFNPSHVDDDPFLGGGKSLWFFGFGGTHPLVVGEKWNIWIESATIDPGKKTKNGRVMVFAEIKLISRVTTSAAPAPSDDSPAPVEEAKTAEKSKRRRRSRKRNRKVRMAQVPEATTLVPEAPIADTTQPEPEAAPSSDAPVGVPEIFRNKKGNVVKVMTERQGDGVVYASPTIMKPSEYVREKTGGLRGKFNLGDLHNLLVDLPRAPHDLEQFLASTRRKHKAEQPVAA